MTNRVNSNDLIDPLVDYLAKYLYIFDSNLYIIDGAVLHFATVRWLTKQGKFKILGQAQG